MVSTSSDPGNEQTPDTDGPDEELADAVQELLRTPATPDTDRRERPANGTSAADKAPPSTEQQPGSVPEQPTATADPTAEHSLCEINIEHIRIRITPRLKEEWEDFLKDAKPGYVAVDGRVIGDSLASSDELIWNINHARNIPKEFIGATCEQTLRASDAGVFRNLTAQLKSYQARQRRKNASEEPEEHCITICVEDPDPDVLWTIATVVYAEMYRNESQVMRRLRAGVRYEDIIDRNNGTLPVDFIRSEDFSHLIEMLQINTWVSEPYRSALEGGSLGDYTARQMADIIVEGVERIHQYITADDDNGQPWSDITIPVKYKKIEETQPDLQVVPSDGWTFTTQEEQWARALLATKGVKRLLSLKGARDSGGLDISALSIGADANFDIPGFCELMNYVEQDWIQRHPQIQTTISELAIDGINEWGTHGANVGGSPKITGTFLPIELVIHVQNSYVGWKDQSLQTDAHVADRSSYISAAGARNLIDEFLQLTQAE